MKSFRVIGLMSGTSLDGLDIADVTFNLSDSNQWSFVLNQGALYIFDQMLLSRLKAGFQLPAHELIALSADLGRYYAEKVNCFIAEYEVDRTKIDLLSSHGQTIFHQPQKGYTLQIGNGPELAVNTNLKTVVDFRTKDVALGGNGAPLIPVADHLIFSNYADTFLNLGGFSNFSFKENGRVLSYDICPVNILINELMREVGQEFDENGNFGKQGEINMELLSKLNLLPFYNETGPKSLGWEWMKEHVSPLLNKSMKAQDKIRTLYEHMAFQIGLSINKSNSKTTLVTGGGAKNNFLIERIRFYTKSKIVVPNNKLIDYKEAIGFAFLGLLRWQEKINVWSSVTGSKRDSSSGVLLTP